MKKTITYLTLMTIILCLGSCLKSNLEELPAFDEAEITNFRFEYRWMGTNEENEQLRVVQLNNEIQIDSENKRVSCNITVPSSSADFPDDVRAQVSLNNLVGYADISTAATLLPASGSPELGGKVADFSKGNIAYEVTAADGTR